MTIQEQTPSPHTDTNSSSLSLPYWKDKLLAALLKRCFDSVQHGHLTIALPGGELLSFGSAQASSLHISITSHKVLSALFSAHPLALAESYLQGHWHCADLTALFRLFQRNRSDLLDLVSKDKWTALLARLYHARRANSKKGSRRNISDHYDLGNDFYEFWLDESMSYSSAYQMQNCSKTELIEAQERKYEHILDLAQVPDNGKILEIGCGWAAMAATAAKRGHQLDGVTLSKEQLHYAQSQLREQNLDHLAKLSLTDYRDIKGNYDAIVSVEMLEAVGEANWPTYFKQIKESLKPGARAVIQVIVIKDEHFDFYRYNVDFIQRYVFPGGFLPCPKAMKEQIASQGLRLEKEEYFGKDYELTLQQWRKDFLKNWSAIKQLGFDERFKRLWTYYLCYCEAGFAEESLDVGFYVIQKPFEHIQAQ
ncbi:MAG TPA: class I SAM-dependent methyltransferase [Rhizobiales bacterium]|nr:class I SAM-dependent methyltransferase [Hyphomicrobiales bacterium]